MVWYGMVWPDPIAWRVSVGSAGLPQADVLGGHQARIHAAVYGAVGLLEFVRDSYAVGQGKGQCWYGAQSCPICTRAEGDPSVIS